MSENKYVSIFEAISWIAIKEWWTAEQVEKNYRKENPFFYLPLACFSTAGARQLETKYFPDK